MTDVISSIGSVFSRRSRPPNELCRLIYNRRSREYDKDAFGETFIPRAS